MILNALDIEYIQQEEPAFTASAWINKYVVWSSFLTLLIVICSFSGWIRFYNGFERGETIYRTLTGWKGYTYVNDYRLDNAFLSICAIATGLIVISHSVGLIRNKFRYVILQLVCLTVYLLGLFEWSHRQGFELRPGLVVMSIATILLVVAYKRSGRKYA